MNQTNKILLQRIDRLLVSAKGFDNELRDLRKEVEKSVQDVFKAPASSADQPATPAGKPAPTITPVKPEEATPEKAAPIQSALQSDKVAASADDKKTPPPIPIQAKEPVSTAANPAQPAKPAAMVKPQPKPYQPPRPTVSTAKPKKTFFERFPQLEKLLGEKLIPFIGILVLVTGIGFFVSYAIDKGWINETARAGIGLLAGGILVGIAHRLRKNYRVFSSVLLGGGIATMYFTIYYAYDTYQLFSQGVAFAIMCVLTLFTTLASVYYDRKEIAILGLIGGFASPILVGDGGGDYVILFSYMIILNVGMTALAWMKDWKIINVLSFGFTVILFGGRMFQLHGTEHFSDFGFLAFGTAFYVLFFVMNIAYNLSKGLKFKVPEYLMLMINTGAYFAVGIYILGDYQDGSYQGLFTALIAVFNFIFAAMLYRRRQLDQNLIYALIGLVLTFLTMAAPIQLDGNFITLFWAAECVLLLWLSQLTKLRILRSGSVIVAICMLGSLIMDWSGQFQEILWGSVGEQDILPIVFNKLFITTMISLGALVIYNLLLRKEEEENANIDIFGLKLISVKGFKQIFPFITTLFIYFGGLLEVRYQMLTRSDLGDFRALMMTLYHLVFVVGIYAYLIKFKNNLINGMAMVMNILVGMAFIGISYFAVSGLRDDFLFNRIDSMPFFLHYAGLALVGLLIMMAVRHFRKEPWLQGAKPFFIWVLGIFGTALLSIELDHVMVMALTDVSNPDLIYGSIDRALLTSHKAGYPVLWGGVAFLFIVNGLKRKSLNMRIFGLSLLGFVLLKIFAVDVWEMTELGRIIAFISLGILILVIAFMYQRIRKLLFDDQNKAVPPAAPKTPTS